VIVLGGGVRAGGSVPPWVEARLERAFERSAGSPIVCLSAGTVHKPNPLDETGRPIFEAVAGARYLIRRGVPPERLFIEACSWDTVGNAYFARMIHTEPRRWLNLLVVTSEFHMPRTEAIFRWVFGLPEGLRYNLQFDASANAGIPEPALAERRARERTSLETIRALEARLRSLPELHQWLFTAHAAYRASLAQPAPAAASIAEWY